MSLQLRTKNSKLKTKEARNQPTIPEHELILAAVRPDHASDDRIREFIRRGVDWQVLGTTALRHGVLPLLYTRLDRMARDVAPQEELARLRGLFLANSRRNLLMTAELLKLLRLFNTRGIPVIPFKGPVLAVQAYGGPALRQFVDLDLLVRREEIKEVEELLMAHGYRLRYAFTPAQERAHLKRTCEFTFSPVKGTAHLDVHWRFAADYLAARLDPAVAFAGQGTVLLEGHPVPMLAPADMLLYLCLHGVFHLWTELSTICDVAWFVQANPDLDWQDLFRKAEAAGLRRTVLLGLALAHDICAAELPATVAGAVAGDRTVARLREHVRAQLFARDGEEPGFMEMAWFQLLTKERLTDRLRYCFIRAFCPTVEDWQRIPLPDSLYFLYFFLRPLRLTGLLPSRT